MGPGDASNARPAIARRTTPRGRLRPGWPAPPGRWRRTTIGCRCWPWRPRWSRPSTIADSTSGWTSKDPGRARDRRARSADDRGRVGLLPGRAPSGGSAGGRRNPRQDGQVAGSAAGRKRAVAAGRARCEAPIGGCGWPPWKRLSALQPQTPFAGSSHVLESLAYLAASTGGRRALVVSPNTRDAGGVDRRAEVPQHCVRFGGHRPRGGADGLAHAPTTNWSSSTWRRLGPPAEEIVQQLHQDYRTASLRIGLVARAGFLKRAERIAEEDPLTIAFSQPIDAEAARWQLGQLMALHAAGIRRFFRAAGPGRAGLGLPGEAGRHVRQALRHAPGGRRRAGRFAGAAIERPRRCRAGQHRHAGEPAGPGRSGQPFRQPADGSPGGAAWPSPSTCSGSACCLDQEAIRRQYCRYNESASQDVATQKVLASILSTIESRATPSMLEAARKGAAWRSRSSPSGPPRKPKVRNKDCQFLP